MLRVSICASFVCHSPLKLQPPSRRDFSTLLQPRGGPEAHRPESSANTTPRKTLRLICSSHSGLLFHHQISPVWSTRTPAYLTSPTEAGGRLPHCTSPPPLMKPETFASPPPCHFALCYFPASLPCPCRAQRGERC